MGTNTMKTRSTISLVRKMCRILGVLLDVYLENTNHVTGVITQRMIRCSGAFIAYLDQTSHKKH